MQTIPEYICANLDTGQSIHFAPDTWFWVTAISGEDGLDVSISESQSAGQIGKSINGRAVGSRSVTVTGDIVGDYDASERLLKRLIQAGAPLRWTKILGTERWYLDGEAQRLPEVDGEPGLLHFQFKFKAPYPYWRTEETVTTMLGGLDSTWFPTPVSTAGSWYISQYRQSLYTTVVNTGNQETAFTLHLRASARVLNPMLWHNGTRTFIRLNKEMLPGERAVISTEEDKLGCTYYGADGSEQDGFRWMDYDTDWWMTLAPGDNVLRLTAEEGRENLTVTITAPKGVASNV